MAAIAQNRGNMLKLAELPDVGSVDLAGCGWLGHRRRNAFTFHARGERAGDDRQPVQIQVSAPNVLRARRIFSIANSFAESGFQVFDR